jgi:Spy/CpxP family protein refolding chaperone
MVKPAPYFRVLDEILYMNKLIFTSVIACLFASMAMAQSPGAGKDYRNEYRHQRHHQRYHRGHRHHRMALSRTLNFSDQQKVQLKTMQQDFHQKMVVLNKNENITVKVMRDQKAALVQNQRKAFQQILTPEQKTKLEDMKKVHAKRSEEMASHRVDKMKEKLSLSEDQTAKIKSLGQHFREQMQQFRNAPPEDRTAKREAIVAMVKQHKEDLKGILTPEQMNKYQEWKKERTGRL